MPRLKGTDRDDVFAMKGKKIAVEEDPIALRVGGRQKKAKVVFDPSENNMPRKRQGRSYSMCGERGFDDKPMDNTRQKRPKLIVQSTGDNSSDRSDRKSQKNGESTQYQEPEREREQMDGCYICGKSENKKNRKLIGCKECEYKVHPDCLKINTQNQTLLETNWRCPNCITCFVCYETSESGNIVTCCICVESYHIKCITPKSLQKNINKLRWECYKCRDMKSSREEANIGNEGDNSEEQPSAVVQSTNRNSNHVDGKKCSSSQSVNIKKEPFSSSHSDSSPPTTLDSDTFNNWIKREDEIPDVKQWTCEEVTNFIKKYFPGEAMLFQEQQIDGPCLMLMKRSDVMNLPIKLGPAIRLYSLIARIQTKSNDPRLTWM